MFTMSRRSLALSLSMAGLAATRSHALVHNPAAKIENSRRNFVQVGTAATMGWLLNLDATHQNGCQCVECTTNSHAPDCQCSGCASSHGAGCDCAACNSAPSFFRPPAAMAYERDVGGPDRSPETAAFNIQARLTNKRLEESGFKLDTKEEEAARLSSAMSSFSYDASTPKQATGRGYGGKASKNTSEKK